MVVEWISWRLGLMSLLLGICFTSPKHISFGDEISPIVVGWCEPLGHLPPPEMHWQSTATNQLCHVGSPCWSLLTFFLPGDHDYPVDLGDPGTPSSLQVASHDSIPGNCLKDPGAALLIRWGEPLKLGASPKKRQKGMYGITISGGFGLPSLFLFGWCNFFYDVS